MTTAIRRTICRYLGKRGEQCTAEAVDPDGELLLCAEHLGRALQLIRRNMKKSGITRAPAA
jgi:hypothetical protein